MKINLSKYQERLRNSFLNPFSFSLFFLFNVPMGWFSGMRLKHLDTKKAISKIPFRFFYRWQNKNPFKSIYFAVQCMGAELSSASMVALAVEGHKPSIAYIVTKMRSQYFKKATGTTTFTCDDGNKIFSAVNKALNTKEGVEIEAKSTGTLEDGTIVSEFHFTWSIKQRNK